MQFFIEPNVCICYTYYPVHTYTRKELQRIKLYKIQPKCLKGFKWFTNVLFFSQIAFSTTNEFLRYPAHNSKNFNEIRCKKDMYGLNT